MRDLPVGGWLKNSFIDFPGTVSTVLFFSGCNLRCGFCHNPTLVTGEYTEPLSVEEFDTFLAGRQGLIEGVVLSGGEPALHPEAAKLCVTLAREKGYKIKLDTNGMKPEIIGKLAPDYLALDVKTLPEKYRGMLKAPCEDAGKRLLQSIEIAKTMKDAAEIRITVVPGLIDRKSIEKIGRLCHGVHRIFLQPMQQNVELLDPAYTSITPFSHNEIVEFKDILQEYTETCSIRKG
ncbi:MAG: anaerobic ribonucleoside-triphosphate reductase activating protein [Chitinivibrionales bacterium]|nr:anaerobic ribonucleoside-triphosphate reductase activating protein [Chitinivibrionales bacterium]